MNNKYPFHLYGCEVISRTEDKRPNFITKDASIALIAQKIQRFWELWARNNEDQNKYFINLNIVTPCEVAVQMWLSCYYTDETEVRSLSKAIQP